MRLVFAGTPGFADAALRSLIAAGHSIELVLTQPDRPSGRGKKLQASPVKHTALAHGLRVAQPERLRDPATWEPVRQARADAMIVAAYGLILPAGLLQIPRLGCLNIHASLLPRWRGAAPVQRAIAAGDRVTGICIMQMDEGLDTGPVLLARPTDIGPAETGGQLLDRLAAMGGEAVVEVLDRLADSTKRDGVQPRPQSDAGITYANKIVPADRWLDWRRPAVDLVNQIRAFDPVPGSAARLASDPDQTFKIWRASVRDIGPSTAAGALPSESGAPAATSAPGRIHQVADALVVSCGNGSALQLLQMQRPGGQRLDTAQFQQGAAALVPGDQFLLPACG